MVGNPHLNQLTKNPIQGGNPNATVMNNLVNMPMSMAPNNNNSNNGTNAMPMQGEEKRNKIFPFVLNL